MMKPVITSEWLNTHLDDSDLIILDASPKTNVSGLISEFDNIQIPKARYFDLKQNFSLPNSEFPNTIPSTSQFELNAQKLGINNSSKIVVYDNLGTYSSPRVWWLFKTFGHQNVSVLEGGLPDWKNHDFPTEPKSTKNNVALGDFKAQESTNLIRNYNDIKENINSNKELIIDARSSERFNGSSPEPRKKLQSGKIPNSKNLPFNDILVNGHFLSETKLSHIFQSLNPENKPLIFSCGSGLTACIIALGHEIATGKPSAIYDGSWTEWATKEKLFT